MGEEKILVTVPYYMKDGFLCFTNKRLVSFKRYEPLDGVILGGIAGGMVGAVIGGIIETKIQEKQRVHSEFLANCKKNFEIYYDELETIVFVKSKWSKNEMIKLSVQRKGGKLEKIKNVELYPKDADLLFQKLSSFPQLNGKISEIYE
ncbi:MAG: hypothetical protein QW386_05350 [Candidatus Bathyarchaeia archaeon]